MKHSITAWARRVRRHARAANVSAIALGLLILSSCADSGGGGPAVPKADAPTNAVPGQTLTPRALPSNAYLYPLTASADGRYLVDQRGTPFFMIGDSAQSATVNLTYSEADQYLSRRAAQGFNAVNMNAMEHKYGQGGKGATLSG